MKKLSFLSLLPIVFLIFSCQKKNIESMEPALQSSKQAQIANELNKIRDMKFVEIPLEQIVEKNKYIPKKRKLAGLVRITGNQIFKKSTIKGNSIQDQLTREEFEAAILPDLLAALSISENQFNNYSQQISAFISTSAPNEISGLNYTSTGFTDNLWTSNEFLIAKTSYSEALALVSMQENVSIIVQTLNAYENFVAETGLLSESEREHLLENIALVKIIVEELIIINTPRPNHDFKCAGDVVVPMLAGAATGDGVGAAIGLAAGLWNAYSNGCMD